MDKAKQTGKTHDPKFLKTASLWQCAHNTALIHIFRKIIMGISIEK